MTPPPRRADDPESLDGAALRVEEPTFRIGYKEASVSVRGVSVFMTLGIMAIVGSNLYSGYRTEQAIAGTHQLIMAAINHAHEKTSKEHSMLRIAQDRTSCVLTMSQEDRTRFRDRYVSGAFRQMCPWVDE